MNSLRSTARTEWLKVKNYKPFWVLFALYPVTLTGIVAIALWGQWKIQSLAPQGAVDAANSPFAFPQVWQNVAYIASWLQFVTALLLILNVTNEFSFRSHRQNLLEGWSRAQFLGAKLSLCLGLSLYCTVIVFGLSVAAGLVSGSVFALEGSSYIALFFLQAVFYAVFVVFLAFLIRRAALTMAAYLMYSVLLENILSFLINLKFQGVGGYFPLKVASGLLPFSAYEDNVPQAAKDFFSDPSQTTLLAVTGLYLSLFVGFMWFRFRREDL
jgi:ABC-2 type transport system permease protein